MMVKDQRKFLRMILKKELGACLCGLVLFLSCMMCKNNNFFYIQCFGKKWVKHKFFVYLLKFVFFF